MSTSHRPLPCRLANWLAFLPALLPLFTDCASVSFIHPPRSGSQCSSGSTELAPMEQAVSTQIINILAAPKETATAGFEHLVQRVGGREENPAPTREEGVSAVGFGYVPTYAEAVAFPTIAPDTESTMTSVVDTGTSIARSSATSTPSAESPSTTTDSKDGLATTDTGGQTYEDEDILRERPNQPLALVQLQRHVSCMAACIGDFGPQCASGMLDCICNHLRSPLMKSLTTCVKELCPSLFPNDPLISQLALSTTQGDPSSQLRHYSRTDQTLEDGLERPKNERLPLDDRAITHEGDAQQPSSETVDSSRTTRSDQSRDGDPTDHKNVDNPLHPGLALVLMQQARECWKAGFFVPQPEDIITKRSSEAGQDAAALELLIVDTRLNIDANSKTKREIVPDEEDVDGKQSDSETQSVGSRAVKEASRVGGGGWGNDIVGGTNAHLSSPAHSNGGVGSGGTGHPLRPRIHPRSIHYPHQPWPIWQIAIASIFLTLTFLIALSLVVLDCRDRYRLRHASRTAEEGEEKAMTLHGVGILQGRKWALRRLTGRKSWVVEELDEDLKIGGDTVNEVAIQHRQAIRQPRPVSSIYDDASRCLTD